MQIKDVMTQGCQWIAPETSLSDAALAMRDGDLGFLAVGENDKLIGIITDRDITVRAVADNVSAATQVRDVMTPQVMYCYDDQSVDEICNNMADIKVRRLPVVNRDKRLVGAVSLGDLAQKKAGESGTALQSITAHTKLTTRAA